jgi:hypothetical protein
MPAAHALPSDAFGVAPLLVELGRERREPMGLVAAGIAAADEFPEQPDAGYLIPFPNHL